ncbi:expressed unknown protein [Seminavis robusta]|uniref:Uncharacterized protein n=1 Tax=Seminavis robusta TaxID=568900 RepID=A0A9N8HF08_9STRA|nr:expressed unknown protein [Seminavis robusta]|eukprot:Sro410_g137330.1 n/a (304) ;mRNA; r:10455-11366
MNLLHCWKVLLLFLSLLAKVSSSSHLRTSAHFPEGRRRRLENDNNNNYYDGQNEYYSQVVETCQDLIVQVTSIQTVCDSPQTFYYGSGVHRNSPTCNLGDKATTTVYFDVSENLENTNIYVVLSVYAGYGNDILTSSSPKNLQKYVGYSCNEAGSYSFTYTTTLGSSSSSSSSSSSNSYGNFIPYHQIAFSSQTNGDYNLGAANIPCDQWEDENNHEWAMVTAQSTFTTRDFFIEYGILIGTFCVMGVFVAVVVRQRLVGLQPAQQQHLNDKQQALMIQQQQSPPSSPSNTQQTPPSPKGTPV